MTPPLIQRLMDAPWGHTLRRDDAGRSVVVLLHHRNGARIEVVEHTFDDALAEALRQADERWSPA
jgi:hypothetical protein